MGLEISLAPGIIFMIGSFPVTNTLFWSFFISLFLILVFLTTRKKMKLVPGRIQNIIEILIGGSYDFVGTITNDEKKTKRLFPLVFTMFIFTMTANLATLIPGQSAITLNRAGGSVALFRAVMSDYGMVLVMTLIAIILVQIVAIIVNGPFGYLKKFINFKSPLDCFLGIMDLVGEIAKILSLSFRLFGNIFAGEVLTAVMLFLMPFFAPLPFMFLGILTSIVQAFVFSVLTLVFVSMASEIEEVE